MDSVRLRLEAGHRDFISELRHCTMVFVGFPSLRVCSWLPASQLLAHQSEDYSGATSCIDSMLYLCGYTAVVAVRSDRCVPLSSFAACSSLCLPS